MPKFVFDAVKWMEQNAPPTIGAAPEQPEQDEFVFDAEEWLRTKDIPAQEPQDLPHSHRLEEKASYDYRVSIHSRP